MLYGIWWQICWRIRTTTIITYSRSTSIIYFFYLLIYLSCTQIITILVFTIKSIKPSHFSLHYYLTVQLSYCTTLTILYHFPNSIIFPNTILTYTFPLTSDYNLFLIHAWQNYQQFIHMFSYTKAVKILIFYVNKLLAEKTNK